MKEIVLALLVAVAAPAAAQAPRIDVALANFSFVPAHLHLKAGVPVVLHFVNRGSGAHNYSAPAFFHAAGADAQVPGGKIDLKKGEVRDVALAPAAGHYDVHCTHFLHSGLGMNGSIDVD